MPVIPHDHRVDASDHAGLFPLLAATARRQTDGTLALCAGTGLVVAVIAAVFVPLWQALVFPALALAAFGGWGIADRTAAERGVVDPPDPVARLLDATKLLLAVGGVAAAVAFVALALGGMLDNVIH